MGNSKELFASPCACSQQHSLPCPPSCWWGQPTNRWTPVPSYVETQFAMVPTPVFLFGLRSPTTGRILLIHDANCQDHDYIINKLLKSLPDLPSQAEIQLLSHWQNFNPSSCISYTYLIAGRAQPSLFSFPDLLLLSLWFSGVSNLHDHMQLTGWGNASSYLSSWVLGSRSSGGFGNFSWMPPFIILIRPSALWAGRMGHKLTSTEFYQGLSMSNFCLPIAPSRLGNWRQP